MGGCASVQQPSGLESRGGHAHASRSNMAPAPQRKGGLILVQSSPRGVPASSDEGAVTAGGDPAIPSVTLSSPLSDASCSPSSAFASESAAALSPLSPSLAAVPPHQFGVPLTPAQLACFHPTASKASAAAAAAAAPSLSRAQRALWHERILPNPREFMHSHADEWNELVCTEQIPSHFRPALWSAALRVDEAKWPRTYSEYQQLSCACDDQISRDIHRTFATHGFFSHRPVQLAVGRVLHAYALYSPNRSGYVQGHNYLAAMLLNVCVDEAQAWEMMCALLAHPSSLHPADGGGGDGGGGGAKHVFENLYDEGLVSLQNQCRHLDRLVLEHFPLLAEHLKAKGIDALMYATPFFLTLFAHHLPLEQCTHVWDALILAQWNHAGDAPVAPHSQPKRGVVSVAPAPAPPLPLSPHPSPLAHAVSLLSLSILEVSQDALHPRKRFGGRSGGGLSMEKTFQTLQKLEIMHSAKGRKKVWTVARRRAKKFAQQRAAHERMHSESQQHHALQPQQPLQHVAAR